MPVLFVPDLCIPIDIARKKALNEVVIGRGILFPITALLMSTSLTIQFPNLTETHYSASFHSARCAFAFVIDPAGTSCVAVAVEPRRLG
ncbi:hypothetical protein [Candidatus Protochlamydia naegleriophila]|uniref:hypothetical protein n=1 Tax=Candidatus Protochlamydia naegleriophila TaxID=389348 RepID=UPI0013014274|nr:hypothetical protein [Candidatus Protochlamydia naegleriophila]